MKNKKVTKRIITFLLLFVWLFLFRSHYILQENKYTISFDSIDKGIDYQIYYTTKDVPSFSEDKTFKISAQSENSPFKNYYYELLEDNEIIDFRIDFGVEPGDVTIKNLKLLGDKTYEFSPNDIVSGFNTDVESYVINGDELELKSNLSDPNSSIKNLNAKPLTSEHFNLSKFVDWIIIYFGLVWTICFMYKRYKKDK